MAKEIMSRLQILKGPMRGHSFGLKDDTTLIGRGPESDIQITDASMSRRHAKIIRKGDRFLIEDMGSQNGTWIDGQRIKPRTPLAIEEGLLIAMGDILVSLGKDLTQGGLATRYSISLARDGAGKGEPPPLYKDRRITDRDKLEMIFEVSTLLMQTLDINQLCEKILDSLFRSLQRIDGGVILLVDTDTEEPREVIARSRGDRGDVKVRFSRTIVTKVIREGKAVMMSDISQEEESELSESIELMKIKSIMCVPLISNRGTRGVIYVHSVNMPHGFRKDDLYLLTCMSTPAALALENALLYTKTKNTEEALEKAQLELQRQIQDRTSELVTTNELLRREIVGRGKAQEEITSVHNRLEEANRNLQLAYARMRDWKDRLSSQLHRADIGFIIEGNGEIQGFTEKALETTGRSRHELLAMNIMDLLDGPSRSRLRQEMNKAWIDVLLLDSLRLAGVVPEPHDYQAKLMQISTEGGRKILLLLRKLNREG
ncbi:MAG: FHA domain-containing protein [Deltaproteobacteria bacterium]|nr:FHA domain-containing protein [Deltaproteobacteria bacterium]